LLADEGFQATTNRLLRVEFEGHGFISRTAEMRTIGGL